MLDPQDYAENQRLWLAVVRINRLYPAKDKPVRSYLIAAPDHNEAEHRLRLHMRPGDLKELIKLEEVVTNIARVWGSGGQPLDLETIPET